MCGLKAKAKREAGERFACALLASAEFNILEFSNPSLGIGTWRLAVVDSKDSLCD